MEKDKHKGILLAQSLITPTIPATPQENMSRVALLSKVANDLKINLKKTAKAKTYLSSRTLDPEKTEAGYLAETYGKQAPAPLQESMEAIGILKKATNPSLNIASLFG